MCFQAAAAAGRLRCQLAAMHLLAAVAAAQAHAVLVDGLGRDASRPERPESREQARRQRPRALSKGQAHLRRSEE